MARFSYLVLGLVGLACELTPSPQMDAGSLDASVIDAGLIQTDSGAVIDATPVLDAGEPEPSAECGNGEVEVGEWCDDGNTREDDECANDCTPAAPFHEFDRLLQAVLEAHGIAGATLAVTKDERLVLKRAYGSADRTRNREMKRDDRMRIASLSKPITSVAVLKLIEDGRLSLDDRAFAILDDDEPPAGRTRDPRLADITVQHLLHHAGGWDRNRSGDPMFKSRLICNSLGIDGPASARDTLVYMLGQPLDFDPGSDYAYSNFGYLLLGRIIEKVTGQAYDDFVREQVLAPMGVRDMELGRSLAEDQPDDEVYYHGYEGAREVVSVFPQHSERVQRPYGGFHLEAMDAHGGWIAHAEDLVRFLTAIDGRDGRADFLSEASITTMVERPDMDHWSRRAWYYGMGLSVRPMQGDTNRWHNGSLPGTSTIFLRSYHGLTWAVLSNGRTANGSDFLGALDTAVWQAVETVSQWPQYDLFED